VQLIPTAKDAIKTLSTVNASNFVILLGENIFLWQTFLWLLHDFSGIEVCTAMA
jgi:hypothetical protein